MHFISPRKARVRVTSDQRVATKLGEGLQVSHLVLPGFKICAKFEAEKANSVPLSQRISRKLSEKMLLSKRETNPD